MTTLVYLSNVFIVKTTKIRYINKVERMKLDLYQNKNTRESKSVKNGGSDIFVYHFFGLNYMRNIMS